MGIVAELWRGETERYGGIMSPFVESEYTPWLIGFALNVSTGLVLVLAYTAIRSTLPAAVSGRVANAVIGLLFAIAALTSMYVPIHAESGYSVDARTVFILLGSLFGGPVAAAIVGAISCAYRLWMGGPGALGGIVSVIVTAGFGIWLSLRYGKRVIDLHPHELILIGLANTVLVNVLVEVTLRLQGHPSIPMGARVGAFIVFPLGTMLVGSAMGMTHNRIWWQTQRRLNDIVETVSDLVWETDAEGRVTYLSDRNQELLGYDASALIGKRLTDHNAVWDDAAAARADITARRPYSGHLLHIKARDGSTKTLSLNGRPVFDRRNRFMGYRGTAQDITERIKMETELRRSRDFLARAQKIGHVGSGSIDLITGEAVWSDEQYRMLGFEPESEEALSFTAYLKRVHPDDRERLNAARAANERGEDSEPVEYRFRLNSGDYLWVRRISEIERDATGKPIQLFTAMIDITESRRLEEESRRSEDHLRKAQRAARMGSVEVDLPTGKEYWSEGMYVLCGIEPDPAKANYQTFMDYVHPDDRARIREHRDRNNLGQSVHPIEYRLVRSSGETIWVRREVEMTYDPATGLPLRRISIHQDITESRRLEEELRRSADHLKRAQYAAHMGSAEVDLATGAESWSDGMFALCGIAPDPANATYENFIAIVHPDDREMIKTLRDINNRGGATRHTVYRQLKPNGEVRWIRREVEVGFDASGAAARLIAIHTDITESRRLEDELRRSADHLQRAQRTARIGSAEVDFVSGREYWSDGMFRVCGIDPDPANATFEKFMTVVHPDDQLLMTQLRSLNAQGMGTYPTDYRQIRPNGEVRWIRRDAEIGFDPSGKPIRLITIHQDVTESKLAEQELRRSRDANARGVRTLRMLSDCNQLLIQATDEFQLINDICRTICEAGDYMLAWVGYAQRDAAKSVTPVAWWGKGDAAETEALVDSFRVSWDENTEHGRGPMGRALRSGKIENERDLLASASYAPWRQVAEKHNYRATLTIPLKDGDEIFGAIGIYAATVDAFDAAETELLAELGSDLNYGIHALRTRAARDKAERELSDTQDALRAIMDHTVDGLVTFDDDGIVMTFSRPAQTIFGYAAEDVIGRNVSMLIPLSAPDDDYLAQLLALGHTGPAEFGRDIVGRRKDGTTFPMDLQIGEIPGGPGGHRFVATMRDITERKQIEEDLQQAKKMEALGQLTGGVAHDFNNLLAVILGRLSLLDEELEDSPKLQSWARSCIKAVERGATLTKSLLAFSRQQALVPMELDLNAVVGDMEEMLQRTLGEAFDVRVFKTKSLWHVEADPGQLQNALLNLVLNARDAMPKGGSVMVSTSNTKLDADYAASHRDVKPGDYVLLAVSDTGVGMPREVLERAFEPFYTTKEVGKGSGLGLSMVYGFVKQTGGHVSIYSEPGRGTTVRIYLPRKVESGAAMFAAPAAPDRVLGGSETILIVEDNEDLRDLTRVQLERYGYKVLEASHGAEGLRTLAGHPGVDLLISDVVLPHGMTGPDLADQAVAQWPELKVIFMSGYNEEHDALERTRARRPVRLLQKPFRAEELAAMIRATLD